MLAPATPSPAPTIHRMVLTDAPDVCVADVALGLTVYLAEPLVWARSGAAHLLARFAALASGTGVRWWTTSRLLGWRHAEISDAPALIPELMRPHLPRPRHLLSFRWVDDPTTPSAGFSYFEIDDARQSRSGVLQILLPRHHDPTALIELLRYVGAEWPVYSAVGGYLVSWFADQKATAFEVAYRWCLRYLGLDVQDPLAASWRARAGLAGTNWLTLIGNPLFEALSFLDGAALTSRAWHHDVRPTLLRHGLLLQAGAAPTLGDVNRGELPRAYAEVARALGAAFVQAPPFPGRFDENDGTSAWFDRFLTPGDWARR